MVAFPSTLLFLFTQADKHVKNELVREVVVELSPVEKVPVQEPIREVRPSEPKPAGGSAFSTPLVRDSSVQDSVPNQSLLSLKPDGDGKEKNDSSSQSTTLASTGEGKPSGNNVFMRSEQMPEFPGGEQALFAYLAREIRYPRLARENDISGVVYLRFVVSHDGQIRQVESLRDIGGGCAEEAIRVVRGMPRWKPGRQNGQEVSVLFHLPVRFTIR